MTNNTLEITIDILNQNLSRREHLDKLIKQNVKDLELLLKSETLIDDCKYLIGKFFKDGNRLYKVCDVKEFYSKILVQGVCVTNESVPHIVSFTADLKDIFNYEPIFDEEFMESFNEYANYEKYFKIVLIEI